MLVEHQRQHIAGGQAGGIHSGVDVAVGLRDGDSGVVGNDLITAQRGYEANVTAMQTAKTMFNRTLDLLR